jgi:uncharacterized delta-60 repeat protein
MFLRSSSIIRVFLVSCCFLASAVSSAAAAPADTDRSFGQEGFVNFDTEAGVYASANDLAIGPDGSIYVLRSVQRCNAVPCVVAHPVTRFRPNGGPDGSFGAGGTSAALGTVEGTPSGFNASLALGADARVVAAWVEHGQLVIRRLNPGGDLDDGFGLAGTVRFDFGTPINRVRVTVQGDGKVIVAAEPESGYGGDAVVIARFTAQGALDPTFHGGVPLFTSLGSGFGGLTLTGAGGLVVAGPRCCSADGRAIHVARFDDSGAFDASFGRQGELFVDDVSDGTGVGAIVARPNGRIYVVGSGRAKGDAFALRLLPNGRLDRKFGNRGIAYMRQSFLEVAGAAVDRAGRLLIFGTSPTGTSLGPSNGPKGLTVLRRLADGRPDPTFAGGALVQPATPRSTRVVSGGLQDGRRLVVLANSGYCIRTCPSPRNFLIRFLGGTSGSRCLGERATIVGTRHGEKLVGTRRRDVIASLAGNDLVKGRGGDDLICGGRGDDRLSGGKGRDVLRGGAGRNQLSQK